MGTAISEIPSLDRYILARWCYGIGEDFISDIEYDHLHNRLKEAMPDNEYVRRSWSDDPCPMELLEKYGLQHLYRDIKFEHKSESIRSINTNAEFREIFSRLDEPSRLSYKLDGFNIQVNYYNGKPISAETRGRRGNSLNANAVLDIVPQSIPKLGRVKVTGELVVCNSEWERFKLETGNVSQRNSVATALANGMMEYTEFVAFNIQYDNETVEEDIYSLLRKFGFIVPYNMKVSDFSQLQNAMAELAELRESYNYPNDGLVIENTKYQLALRVGAWQEEEMQSYVTGYDENVGLHGNAMVVNVAPVVQDDRTIRQVSVTNLSYIIGCELQIGSPIAFDNRSMATAVLNVERTKDLHEKYAGRYDVYRRKIDNSEKVG